MPESSWPMLGPSRPQPMTRTAAIEFNIARVRTVPASAVKRLQRGNRIALYSEVSYAERTQQVESRWRSG